MSTEQSTPWHKASFDRFLQERLPELLADCLPLTGYRVEPTGRYTCRVTLSLAAEQGDVEAAYDGLPQPDEEGLFEIDGQPCVVIPTASREELDRAEIRCVGEQLGDDVEERLGQAPPDLPWDTALLRAWLPLGTWIWSYLRRTAQQLDATNWLSRHTHLRRLLIPDAQGPVVPGQEGRVCPFETPEGTNLGRVLTIAVGAEICEGRLIAADGGGVGLGLSASMIPLLEHDDANRLLMGANMLRQWVVQSTPEPALVQSGCEPDARGFWNGRNLLTAYVSWGADTCADGIAISESCARRFDLPHPLEPGDKLSNRHGTKGVVSRVLPDDEMPHLADGTAVELVYSFSGLHVRMNHGQVREAVLGRIARAEGRPAVAPAFQGPGEAELRERLVGAGLPASGMEVLTAGRDGPPLEWPSTVGWVYWGRLFHIARDKVRVWASDGPGQMQGEMEAVALRQAGAYENLREMLNTRAWRREGAAGLDVALATGTIEQAGPPTPMFAELLDRLQVAGIRAALEGERLTFRFASPGAEDTAASDAQVTSALVLARSVPHPWLQERSLSQIGAHEAIEAHDARAERTIFHHRPEGEPLPSSAQAYARLVKVNDRLGHMLDTQAPESLIREAVARLEQDVRAFFEVLLSPADLRFRERQLYSGRAVIAPSTSLRVDQVGLAQEMAWTLFGSLVARELDGEAEVRARSERAVRALDEVMARTWVIVNRAPSLSATALLAFHPVRDPGSVLRLHPLACELLDADFDGDQVAVLLPLTEAAQREAGQRLSVAGHLARDPDLIESLLPPPEAVWGLASLAQSEEGRREIARLAGAPVATAKGLVTRATLAEAVGSVLRREGVAAALAALERLTKRGFEVARASGASMSPFIGASLRRPPQPEGEDPQRWAAYREELAEQVLLGADYDDPDLGPQRIAVNVRQRGRRHLSSLLGARGPTLDGRGGQVVVRHSLVEGLTPEEMYAHAAGARRGLSEYLRRWEQSAAEARAHGPGGAFTVLARARQSERPGVVFARAAASGEVDPLLDVESRLLVGLPVRDSVGD